MGTKEKSPASPLKAAVQVDTAEKSRSQVGLAAGVGGQGRCRR